MLIKTAAGTNVTVATTSTTTVTKSQPSSLEVLRSGQSMSVKWHGRANRTTTATAIAQAATGFGGGFGPPSMATTN